MDRITIQIIEATESLARIQVRLHESRDATITGNLTGPRSLHSRTLPAMFPIRADGEILVTDPCYWTSDSPFLYDLRLEARRGDRLVDQIEESIGLKRPNTMTPSTESEFPPELSRYARQIRYKPFGTEGQQRLHERTALVVGCGALGSVIANTLARAGVGTLRIVDRDFLELNNLQRQVLYDEEDVAAQLPKAIAAANRLQAINSEITIEPAVSDVTNANISTLAEGAHVIVDGTDNFETRMLVNDYCVKNKLPWVYGGCVGAEGQTMAILPGETACLTCLLPEVPPPGTTPTCDTAGILGPVVNVIASLQAMEALKILSGNLKEVSRMLTVIDLWQNRLRQVDLGKLRERGDCPTCGRGEFLWLSGEKGSQSASLCGRNAVQLRPDQPHDIDLEELERRLVTVGRVTRNPFLLRLEVAGYTVTQFPDGRAIVAGTDDVAQARTIYARYVGS